MEKFLRMLKKTSTKDDTPPPEDRVNTLTQKDLSSQIDDVFHMISKIGQGAYGSVYKALHKESGTVLAIKQVPMCNDNHKIIKEISILQQCYSPYIVRYYGSYFKYSGLSTDLWIVMEYCGAGSVSDIIKLRKKTLLENEIATILYDTLKGLSYLHSQNKIHRDIKAGNILLTSLGHAKLADFGVSKQLSDNMLKANTVIGTPFWMAPEVIEEVGYGVSADMWSLGITALEMAEGLPPYSSMNPMRAIFMIPMKPPPTFQEPDQWSDNFIEFVSKCLVKNPNQRGTAEEMLTHEFMVRANPKFLENVVVETRDARSSPSRYKRWSYFATSSKPKDANSKEDSFDSRTFIVKDTLVLDKSIGASGNSSSSAEGFQTMIINSDEEDGSAMIRHDTGLGESIKNYRPLYMKYYDMKIKKKSKEDDFDSRTEIVKDTLVPDKSKGASGNSSSSAEGFQTMIINSDEEDYYAMIRNDPILGESIKNYRPLHMKYYDMKIKKKSKEDDFDSRTKIVKDTLVPDKPMRISVNSNSKVEKFQTKIVKSDEEDKSTMINHYIDLEKSREKEEPIYVNICELRKWMENDFTSSTTIVKDNPVPDKSTGKSIKRSSLVEQYPTMIIKDDEKYGSTMTRQVLGPNCSTAPPKQNQQNSPKEDNYDFVKYLSHDELIRRLANLENEMEDEIYKLKCHYEAKCKPILEVMDKKCKEQPNL